MSVEAQAEKASGGSIREVVKIVFHAVILAAIVRLLFFQPFHIPSGSMMSTLQVGDYLFISRYSYGYSRFSIPFAPAFFSGRIFGSTPKRGDVAVFQLVNPDDGASTDYIKRVVGLPGDRIQMIGGVLHINGQAVNLRRVEDFAAKGAYGYPRQVAQFEEMLPNGVRHRVLDLTPTGDGDNTRVFLVPKGHYFMMGDNRDNSSDSRFNAPVGFIPLENFIGRAELIYFSHTSGARFFEFWRWPQVIRWKRVFSRIN